MKKDAELEMRAEYDFTKAAPGRHAPRFGAREREDLITDAASRDVRTWLSYSLLHVQALEAALFSYLFLAEERTPEDANEEATALFEGRSEDGLSGLLNRLRNRGCGDSEFERRLRLVIAERNWLVHRGGLESQHADSSSGPPLALITRLQHIAREAEALKDQFEGFVQGCLADNGLSRSEIGQKADEATALWLASAA
jgi:hypothetical protein